MANFKASSSSSGFVIGTTVLLLLVVISIYGAPAAAAATACSSSSKVMLFNSSSLEVVEQAAKDQGTTEFAIDYHEIQRRVLQGSLADEVAGWTKKLMDSIVDGLSSKAFKATNDPDEYPKLKNTFNNYCSKVCPRSNSCPCQNQNGNHVLKFANSIRSCGPYTIYYCFDNITTTVTTGGNSGVCCGAAISSYGGNQPNNDQTYNNQQPTPYHYSRSPIAYHNSGSPIAYDVVMTVIAIFTTSCIIYVLLLV